MPFRLRITPLAQQDIDELAAYLGAYDEDFAVEQIDRLNRILLDSLAVSPHTCAYFPLTGRPIEPICSALAGERTIGLFMQLTRKRRPWMSCASGMPAAIQGA